MQDQIKKIAEGLGYDYSDGEIFTRDENKYPIGRELFNPYENEGDAFKVLEDLVKKTNSYLVITDLFDIGDSIDLTHVDYLGDGENGFKESICKSWLAIND